MFIFPSTITYCEIVVKEKFRDISLLKIIVYCPVFGLVVGLVVRKRVRDGG